MKKNITNIKRQLVSKLATKKRNSVEKPKSYRLQGKHLFLTYAQYHGARENIWKQLEEKLDKWGVEKYLVSTEKHKDGNPHAHVYIRLNRKCNIINNEYLDILDEKNEKKHGKYESCRSYQAVIGYVSKEGLKEALTNMDLTSEGKEVNVWWDVLQCAESGDIEKGLDILKGKATRSYIMDHKKLVNNLHLIKERANPTEMQVYDKKSFDYSPKILNWLEKESSKKTLVLVGPSGIGKTESIKSLLAEKFKKSEILRVTDINGLKKLKDRKYKAIMLDDVNFASMSVESIITLFDIHNGGDLRILYESVELPPGMPRALISNKDLNSQLEGKTIDARQMAAIKRRVVEVTVTKSMKITIEKKVTLELSTEEK